MAAANEVIRPIRGINAWLVRTYRPERQGMTLVEFFPYIAAVHGGENTLRNKFSTRHNCPDRPVVTRFP